MSVAVPDAASAPWSDASRSIGSRSTTGRSKRSTAASPASGTATYWSAAAGDSHIVPLVERRSCHLLALQVHDATSPTVVAIAAAGLNALPAPMRRSLTWDRGMEMTGYHDFTRLTGTLVYFCDAYSPWERGTNENTSGLLRQYFPKKTDLALTSPEQLLVVVNELNHRPRGAL